MRGGREEEEEGTNLLAFPPSRTIHPPVLGPNPPSRRRGQRDPVLLPPLKQPKGLTRAGGGGWHRWPWLCTPCPRHVAVGVCRLRALVRLWVSLQLLSVAALKIEQRIRSSQRFLLAGAFNASLAAGFVREGGVKVYVWGVEAHGIDRAGGCPFPAPLQDPQPHAWGGEGQEAVPPRVPWQQPALRLFFFCFSELKLLFPPDSGVALPLLPCRCLLSAARSVLSPGPTSVFHRGVFF